MAMATRSKDKDSEVYEDAKALDTLQVERLTLIGKRDIIFSRLQDIFNRSLKAFTDDTEKDLFLCGMISLDRLRSDFNEIVNKLNVTELTLNASYTVNYQSINVFEDMFCRCQFVYNKLNPPSKTADFNVAPQRKSIRIPELDLMVFNGDPMTWRIFYESFKRTIHENPDLTDHERVQYLINKLSGRALAVCSGIVPNGDNYPIIWQTLVDKYDDKRNLASAYLDQMLDFKSFNTATNKNLELFLDKFCTAVSSLKSLKLDNLSDFILLSLALRKIDSSTARSFEMHMRGKSMPTYNELLKFIREQSKILERTTTVSLSRSDNRPGTARSTQSFAASCVTHCPLCKQADHANLYRCPAFVKLSIDDRYTFVKQSKGCTNCLSTTHINTACNSKFNCRYCGCKHHSMLCRKVSSSREDNRPYPSAPSQAHAPPPRARTGNFSAAGDHMPPSASPPPIAGSASAQLTNLPTTAYQSSQQQVSLCNIRPASQPNDTTCLLGTVQVYATDLNGRRHVVRALIDSASQSNFLTSKCCAKLNLKCNKVTNTVVKGIGSASNPIKGAVSATLSSRLNDNFIAIDAYVIDRITDNLPAVKIDVSCLSYLNCLPLADDSFASPSEIDILIGAPLFSEILLSGRAAGPPGTPTAFETIFGFIVIGTAPVTPAHVTPAHIETVVSITDPLVEDRCRSHISLCTFTEGPRLDNLVQRFWQLEEVQCTPTLSPDAIECERIFTNNVSRDPTGRYSVALPFSRDPATALGNSYPIAKKRFMYLERKLAATPALRLEYDAIIKEYIQKGYISLIDNDNPCTGYYVPHHAIARLQKTTTRWRMVMDASAEIDSGFSLNPNPLLDLPARVSSWLMLLRIVVLIYRFIKKLHRANCFNADDINYAELQILKSLQYFYFQDVLKCLKSNDSCSRAIQRLVPFVDADGLIRVGGRLRNADLSYDQQHPILLPRKDRIVELIITHYHRRHCHAGPLTLMSILRQKYWILSCRNIVRSVIHKCNYCFKSKPKPTFPLMGDLPACRVNEAKPFIHTAVDYAGPISIIPYRKRGVRSIKAYLCIFVCMVVRAVHVELTTDLSTNSFLSAFKRFLARRGTVLFMYSDNGRNFVGAKNALTDLLNSDEYNKSISDELSANRIHWKFNPPRSPHFGGNYEIYVKAFKSHLHKTIGSQLLTYEEMLTVLTQIECVINSRPITLLSEDPSEPTALSASHFLMTAPLKHLPACTVPDEPGHLLKRYALLDQMVQSFSKRWKLEYLHLLQSRGKWNTPSNPITIGSIVLIITDNIPPLSWPLGVVVATHVGGDGICRVASVKTATGVYQRPVVRLCILPTQ